jgi:hypothetical protein
MGALQLSPFRDVAAGLGYPAYFMSILGVWYASAGLILVAPRLRTSRSAMTRRNWLGLRSSCSSLPHRGPFDCLPVATFPVPQAHPRAVG